jgi:hypothetical protein
VGGTIVSVAINSLFGFVVTISIGLSMRLQIYAQSFTAASYLVFILSLSRFFQIFSYVIIDRTLVVENIF